ncbi:hypothetical protein ACFPN1_16255 [Lysobacter yangpyeongensis]|uniref:Holin n=1 Tax=Lysobacter yangpyeongensis TaxID=346182 RepID=A0ABW0SR52_9GAMM
MTVKDSPFKYLPYVTFREGWAQAKVMFFVWIVLSAIAIAFIALTDFGVESTESYWSLLPKPVWAVIGFAVFTWVVRGEELRLAAPQSAKGWLILNVLVALMVLAGSVLPSWALFPMYFGLACFAAVLDELAAVGKSNYERLSGNGNGA